MPFRALFDYSSTYSNASKNMTVNRISMTVEQLKMTDLLYLYSLCIPFILINYWIYLGGINVGIINLSVSM